MQNVFKQLFVFSMISMFFVSSIANGETKMGNSQTPPPKMDNSQTPPMQFENGQEPLNEDAFKETPVQTKGQKLVQYPLPKSIKTQYAPKEGSAIVLSKVFHLSGKMSFTLKQRNDESYSLAIKAYSPNAKNEQGYWYLSELNKDASIKREQSFKVQKNERILEKEVTARFENQLFLGDAKVITVKKGLDNGLNNEDAGKEWLVNPEDPVLTLCQMIVWIGTIRQIDSEGVLVRLIVDDQPLPVIIKMQQDDNSLVYTAYAAPNLKIGTDPKKFLFKFVFPSDRSNFDEFMFPQQVWLNVNGKAFIIEKEL